MGREQDLLFCKIAISTKKVSQEDAQKCLALANRFEAEGKKRPQVGEIFLKKNLLNDQDNEAHENPRRRENLMNQMDAFLEDGTITNTCGGPCACYEGACGALISD